MFWAPLASFPNITSIGNTSWLHLIAICFAVACTNAHSLDFPPFCPSPPAAEPFPHLFFTLAFYFKSHFPIFATPPPLLAPLCSCREDTADPHMCICVTSCSASTSDLLRLGIWWGRGALNHQKRQGGAGERENGGSCRIAWTKHRKDEHMDGWMNTLGKWFCMMIVEECVDTTTVMEFCYFKCAASSSTMGGLISRYKKSCS